MEFWKQVQARVEPHVNRALLFSILACLVILLTYLLGGAGAFTVFRQAIQANAASAPLAPVAATPSPTTALGSTGGSSIALASGGIALTLRVSPLDIPYDCALGASGSQQLTLTNPDSAAHPFTLSWNGLGGAAEGFVAAVQPSGSTPANTIPAHGTRAVAISSDAHLALNTNPTSQYLWVSEEIAGTSTTVAKVHVWCSTLPVAVPTVPTITLTPPPIP